MIFDIKYLTSAFGCLTVILGTPTAAMSAMVQVENKSAQFEIAMDDIQESIGTNSESELAEKIRKQRAAFNAQTALTASKSAAAAVSTSGRNECDQKLRSCMQSKCGKDFSQCAGDTDTMWGNKLDLCRIDIKCTGEEYRLFTAEIKADRDQNAELAFYTSIIDCGNKYNDCIIKECDKTFTKCLGKPAGDAAIQKCATIAKNCTEQDSGLPSRAMEAFANLRQDAEKAIARDEKRLYELRDSMRSACSRLGALFDDRTLDCVYSVEFRAGGDNTLYASKKAYAGTTFNCDQNWFGVDVTTFMENAFRLTRAQSSASSAAFGAGVGMAAGAITSGAIDRAVDRAKAERALGEELCDYTGGKWNKAFNSCNCPKGAKFDKEQGCVAKDDDSGVKMGKIQSDDSDDEEEFDTDNLLSELSNLSEEELAEYKNNPEIQKLAREKDIDINNISASDLSNLLENESLDLSGIDTEGLPKIVQNYLKRRAKRAARGKSNVIDRIVDKKLGGE